MSKVFDLSKNYNFTKNVQKNLDILKKKFGTSFKIKDKKTLIPVKLIKQKFKKNNFEYYTMFYFQKRRVESLYPFKIDFMTLYLKKKNISYIINIL